MSRTLRTVALRFVDDARGVLLRADGQLLLLAMLLFGVLPQLDLWASAQFFDPRALRFMRDASWARLLYHGASWLARIGGAALLLMLLLSALRAYRCSASAREPSGEAARRDSLRTCRKTGFVLLALLLGPGLIVNEGFKEHWGRARPREVQAFGGSAIFTPPVVPAAQCDSNCSFVSGHAAIGFGLMVFAWVSTRRRLWLALGIGTGSLIGLARLAAGGHFLSDVVFAGFVVWFSTRLIAHLFVHGSLRWRRRSRRLALAPAAEPAV